MEPKRKYEQAKREVSPMPKPMVWVLHRRKLKLDSLHTMKPKKTIKHRRSEVGVLLLRKAVVMPV